MTKTQNRYKFDKASFYKKSISWILFLMAPSILVDFVLFYRLFTHHPVILDYSGSIDYFSFTMLLGVNALFFKGYAFVIFFTFKYIYKNSSLSVSDSLVVYRRPRIFTFGDELHRARYTDYYLEGIGRVHQNKSGRITITGKFRAVDYTLDGIIK